MKQLVDLFHVTSLSRADLGPCWFGVDILTEDIADNYISAVWEPAIVKINALTAAAEAACMILSVDETIKAPSSNVVCLFLRLIMATF